MKNFTFRFLLFGFLFTLCTISFSYGQKTDSKSSQPSPDFSAVKGVLVRVTPKLADIDRTTMYGQPLVKTRDENGIIGMPKHMEETEERVEERMEEKLREQYRRAVKGEKNLANPGGGIMQPTPNNPNVPTSTVSVNFDGQTAPGLQPTDNNMAAGPNHVIQVVNNVNGTQFTIWNKAGTVVQPGTILSSVTGIPGFGDPIVLYDQLADRWFMAEFGPASCCNTLIIAVSVTPNPTGAWKIYSYQDASFFPDYPKFAVWHNAYYAYTNDFNSAGTSFLGTSVWAFDRTAMLAGAATAQMVRQRLNIPNMIAMGVVNLDGMTPSTQNGLFVVPTSATQMGVFEVTPNFASPSITVSAVSNFTVNSWSSSGSIGQQTGSALGSLSPRMMFRVGYRNNSGTESIVAAHTIANGALGQVRWYELRRTSGVWGVFQQGNIAGTDGNSRWMPGIAMDGCGNIALMYDVAGNGSPAAHPSIRYTGRNASDPLNTMTLPESVIINAATQFNGSRWGDYNTTVPDYSAAGVPANGFFWTTSQYGNQLTRIARFSLTGGCAPAPNIVAGSATLVSESCSPANGVIDPGETVTVSFCVQNTGNLNTTNLVGTLQTSGGVISPSGPQTYGVLVAGGPAVCQDFTFTNNSTTCGSTITPTISFVDGATNLGSQSWTFTLGTTVTVLSENFDAVVAPALPAGWVATNVQGAAPLWTTSTGAPQSAPNSLFVDDPSTVSDKVIESPAFNPTYGARLTFSNNFNLENTFDGGVLEISINGGSYQDIIAAGGSFVSGGYVATISTNFSSPIGGRQAWTGNSGGYITTTVNLPNSASGQSVKLRWRMASDVSASSTGWRVDNIVLTQPACCGVPCSITCPANITVNSAANACGANVSFAAAASGLCGPITYSPASGSFFPVGTTTVNVSTGSGSTCSFTVTVVDNTPPTITCPANVTASNTPNLCSAVVNYNLPTVTDNCPLPGQYILSQSAATSIVPIQIGCQSGGLTTANSWWRAYNLAPLGLPQPLTIRTVTFGIETANAASGSIPVTVRLYTSAGAFPGGTRTQVASQTVNVPNQSASLFTVNLTTPPTVPANAIVAVEIAVPDGRAPVNHTFFIGSNASGQTAPSYLQASDCGAANPTDLASLGFPNDHIIINMSGTIPVTPPVLTLVSGIASGGVFPVGVTTNVYQARDNNGLTSQCSFTVTVNDVQAPSITCPANITRNTDAGACVATIVTPAPTFADNCSVTKLTWVMTGATTGSSPTTGINLLGTRAFNLNGTTGQGVTTVTYTATDAAGNSTTCSYTVTVNDAEMPVITAQPVNRFVCVGSNAVFSVTANVGTGTILTYQWQKWNPVTSAWENVTTGGTNATLTLNAVAFTQNTNDYRVVVTGRCSVVISNYATLYVNRLPTVSLAASRTPILLPGESVNLVATVDPSGGTFEWFKNGTLITGASGSSLSDLSVDNIGTYRFRYTDPNGCVSTSNDIAISGAPSDNLYVFPNPNYGQFSVRFFNQVGESATVTVFDAKGARVYQHQMITTTAYTRLDINLGPTLQSGVYIVEVVNSAGKSIGSKRVIVRHQ